MEFLLSSDNIPGFMVSGSGFRHRKSHIYSSCALNIALVSEGHHDLTVL